ncbi:MAG: cytochrome ubiquinol oxidase subunit I, partial [Motiliproteus sp.]|nr:cytochrome ubiquinol oxidase subunit I [Motiliproteus sp.]
MWLKTLLTVSPAAAASVPKQGRTKWCLWLASIMVVMGLGQLLGISPVDSLQAAEVVAQGSAEVLKGAPELAAADYPRVGNSSSRAVVWILAQMHLFFAAFVLAVPLFVVVIEWVGVKTGDARYDDMAHEFMKVSMTAYSIT